MLSILITVKWQYNFFLAWIDLSRVFDFRIYFGKILISFDFDEKLAQSVAQVTLQYVMYQKPALATGQVLSISKYDLENGRMQCKQKYWKKNIVVKVPV